MKDEFLQAVKILLRIAEDIDAPDLKGLVSTVKHKIENDERYIIVLGQTSSGKSTLVNSLINRYLIPTSSIPTTGQVIELSLTQDSKDRFFNINLEGNPQDISLAEFKKLACSSEKDILKLRANITTDKSFLNNAYILDTPGYNSIVSTHPEVFTDFVPQSDAIIYMINYRKGITQTDLPYIKSIYPVGKVKKQIYFVLNFKRDRQPDKRTKEIEEYLASEFGYSKAIYITSHTLIDEQHHLELPELWKDIQQSLDSSQRNKAISENQRNLLLVLVERFGVRIQEIQKIDSLTTEDVKTLEKKITFEKKRRKRAEEIIQKTYINLHEDSQNKVKNFFIALCEKAERTIDKHKSWSEPLLHECTEYLTNHLFPTECRAFASRLNNHIQEKLMSMADILDELVDASFNNIDQFLGIKEDLWKKLKEQSARYGLGKITGYGARRYLAKLGGRGGYRAGFVNFAKKTVSKGGRLFHKVFSRQVYYNMGRTLKKIGLSAEKAIGAFVYTVTEIAVYLGKVAIWKRNLRKHFRKTTEEQRQYFLKNIKRALQNSEDDNNSLTEEIFNDKLQLIEDMLNRRKQDFKVDPSVIKHSQESLHEIKEVLT